jgi:hypothetical protein
MAVGGYVDSSVRVNLNPPRPSPRAASADGTAGGWDMSDPDQAYLARLIDAKERQGARLSRRHRQPPRFAGRAAPPSSRSRLPLRGLGGQGKGRPRDRRLELPHETQVSIRSQRTSTGSTRSHRIRRMRRWLTEFVAQFANPER